MLTEDVKKRINVSVDLFNVEVCMFGCRVHVCFYINISLHMCGRVLSAYFIIPVQASCSSEAPFTIAQADLVDCLLLGLMLFGV